MRSAFPCVLFCLVGLGLSQGQSDHIESQFQTMPHQTECPVPLPEDFWKGQDAEPFKKAEAWAWNQRICLGQAADMRHAPKGSGDGEECKPANIEEDRENVPTNRQLRPEFLELILSHEPWASAPRHPKVSISCALVRGDIDLDGHEIAPTFEFHQGIIDGKVSFRETKFRRTLSFRSSTVTGNLNAGLLEVGGRLFLHDKGSFADVRLFGATIASDVIFTGSATRTHLINTSWREC